MKKLSLMMALIVMLGCMVFISGCGSDKFEGKWVGVRETYGNSTVIELTIKKDGDNYILHDEGKNLHVDFEGNETATFEWSDKTAGKEDLSATAKDNVLTVTKSNGRMRFTYDEPKNELHAVLGGYMVGNEVTFERDTDDNLFEKKCQEVEQKQKDIMKKNYPDYTQKDL